MVKSKINPFTDESSEIIHLLSKKQPDFRGVYIGRIVSTEENGDIFVDYPENQFGPLHAKTIVELSGDKLEDNGVLLLFEKNNPQFPIIIGQLKNPSVSKDNELTLNKNEVEDILIDGDRLILEAEKEIELRCGKSSLIMKRDGKIVIKGTQLVSRSSGANKIKGASVQIN